MCNTTCLPTNNSSLSSQQCYAIADTGASGHYINTTTPCINKKPTKQGPTITLPNGTQIQPSHATELKLQGFASSALQAHILPDITNSLFSIGKFCDDNKIAIFHKEKCYILNDILDHPELKRMIDNNTILTGTRNHYNNLWYVPTDTTQIKSKHIANNVYTITKIKDIIEYHHRTLFSPVKSTLLQAIKNGNLHTFPSLTYANVKKYLPPSPATSKGHMKQIEQNIRSTKSNKTVKNETTNIVYTKTYEITKLICSDQTGRFPIASSRGNKYVMIVLDYDSNAILSEPIPSRSQQHLLQAFTKIHQKLVTAGRTPTIIRLDNEAPKVLQSYMHQNNLKFQLVPPHNHRRNYAEKAIGVWKDHFIAGLTSMDKNFPLKLWCRLTAHADISLNLLRNSRLHPNISAYEDLFGPYDYNAHPLIPPGTKLVIHEKPSQRGSWSPRGIDGWYLGPSLQHYRCHRVYCNHTSAERITDTVHLFPHYGNLPNITAQDAAILTSESLHKTLESPSNKKAFGTDQIEALKQLAIVLKNTAEIPHKPISLIPQLNPTTHQPPAQHNVHQPRMLRNNINQHAPQPRVNEPTIPQNTSPPPPTHSYNLRPRNRPRLTEAETNLCNHIYDATTGKKLTYRQLKKQNPTIWNPSMANELGRLAQGVKNRIKGTNTIHFVPRTSIPTTATVTYARVVPDYRPLKDEPYRTRLTVGGDRLPYDDNTKTDCASLPTIKTHLNSTISTPGAKYATADIKNFYLANNPLKKPEFMRMHISNIPEEIIIDYALEKLVDEKGFVYIKIVKGMYGLKQAGILAHYNLQCHLRKYGYRPCRFTKGLWNHVSNSLTFVLVVDDFGIKYTNKLDLEHFFNALRDRYTISVDMSGSHYVGLDIDWNYQEKFVEISMPKYIPDLLQQLAYKANIPEHAPHTYNKPSYGSKIQYANDIDTSPPLDKTGTKRIQRIIGSLLYYSRAVDPTILVALGSLATQQNKPTQNTEKAANRLLDFVATYPNAVIRYNASDMILHTHSDASYLSEPKARSRAAGHFYLSSHSTHANNGPIHTVCSIIKNVMSSAAEAEIAAAFLTAKDAVPIRNALHEMGHNQPPTPIQTDNSTAHGFLNETIKQKRSKAMDMRFWWLIDRIKQNMFHINWKKGSENLADYFSKHHSPTHHAKMRPTFLQTEQKTPTYSDVLRGCNNTNPT